MTTKTSRAFKKVIRPGTVEAGYPVRRVSVFIKIEYTDDGRLSLSGVVGPRANGDAWGSCGQCLDELRAETFEPAPGWEPWKVKRLHQIWDRWHLNDMRAGCEHQRAAGWEDRRIKPEELPGCTANRDERGILAMWVYPPGVSNYADSKNTHKDGLLMKPCPKCAYPYGSKWLREEVPAETLAELRALPETDTTPAWV